MKLLSYVILSWIGLCAATKHAAKFKFKNNDNNPPQQYQKKKQVVEYIEHFPLKRPSPVGVAQET